MDRNLARRHEKPATDSSTELSTDDQQPPMLMPIRRAIGLTLAGALIVVSTLSLLAYVLLGSPRLAHQPLTASELFDLLKIGFAVVAGVGGVVALVMGYRKQQIAEVEATHAKNAAERAKRSELRDQAKLFNERFATAASQLGSDTPAVSIAGAYAMAGLADDWDDKRQMCIDVLCGFLRLPYAARPEDDAPEEAYGLWRSQREVRNTVVSIIREHLMPDAKVTWSGNDFDFTGAVFDGADLSDAEFRGHYVKFARVRVIHDGLNLVRAKFLGEYVFFGRSSFVGTYFNLGATEFRGTWVSFSDCKFIACNINLKKALVDGCELMFPGALIGNGSRMVFETASIKDGAITFRDATVNGEVDFRGFDFKGGRVDLSNAKWSKAPLLDDWEGPPAALTMPPASS